MNSSLILLAALLALTACGIKRPLIAPRDIPAYEQKRQEKLDKQRIDQPEV